MVCTHDRTDAMESGNSVNGVADFLYTVSKAEHEMRPSSALNHVRRRLKGVAAEAGSISFDVRETERVQLGGSGHC